MNTLMENGIIKVSEFCEDLNRSTGDIAARVNRGVTKLDREFDKVKGNTTKKVANARVIVKKL